MDKSIILTIDQKTLDLYTKYYFLEHPRAKKIPIEKPWHPSINTWMILPRKFLLKNLGILRLILG